MAHKQSNNLQYRRSVVGVVAATTLAVRRRRRREEVRRHPSPPAARRRQVQRKFWARTWLLRRNNYGFYNTPQQELEQEDHIGFQNFLQVDSALFQEILDRVGPSIEKQVIFMREPLEPALRLTITLRYLATGNSYKTLEYEFRVANNTISRIVLETCNAIIKEFAKEFLKCPSTPDEWRVVAEGFSSRWNFHNCLGAFDGKHVAIRAPSGAGSVYYNYKGFHSVVLMALVDSQYRFLYAEVGANGGASDGDVFAGTPLWAALDNNTLGVPSPTAFPRDDQPMPYSIVADDAFAMRTWLMKPYPQRGMTREQRLYNYRLSRARRVVENAFGILAHRFRFLLAPMAQKTENMESIVLAACVLHNMLRTRFPRNTTILADREDTQTHDVIPGTWRDNESLVGLQLQVGNNSTRPAKALRDYQCQYYTSPVGRVPWQDSKI